MKEAAIETSISHNYNYMTDYDELETNHHVTILLL